MTYKDALTRSMELLAQDPARRFLGYNVKYGGKANGTLATVPEDRLIETPVAENLVAGLACGMSLEGFKPVVWFERFDFVLNALDAIVNHLDKIKEMSRGEFDPRVIFRCNVGGSKRPLYTGATHVQDFSSELRCMVSFPVERVRTPDEVIDAYQRAAEADTSYLITEYRDSY